MLRCRGGTGGDRRRTPRAGRRGGPARCARRAGGGSSGAGRRDTSRCMLRHDASAAGVRGAESAAHALGRARGVDADAPTRRARPPPRSNGRGSARTERRRKLGSRARDRRTPRSLAGFEELASRLPRSGRAGERGRGRRLRERSGDGGDAVRGWARSAPRPPRAEATQSRESAAGSTIGPRDVNRSLERAAERLAERTRPDADLDPDRGYAV